MKTFEIGKWYISSLGSLVFYSNDYDLKGFTSRLEWSSSLIYKKNLEKDDHSKHWKLATAEDVKNAFIKERDLRNENF